jgi:hypothetical protein
MLRVGICWSEAYKGPVRIIHGKEDNLVPMWGSGILLTTMNNLLK